MTHLLSNYNCNFSSEQDNYGFFNLRKLGTINNPTYIVVFSVYLFSAAICKLISTLFKGAPFQLHLALYEVQ